MNGLVSKRVNLTLPDKVFSALERWASAEGRPTANLAAFIVEIAIREAEQQGKIPSDDQASVQKKKRSDANS